MKLQSYRMQMRMLCGSSSLKISGANMSNFFSFCLVFSILFFMMGFAFASEAELTNLVIKNTHDYLALDLEIKSVFTEEMKEAVLHGIPVRFAFLVVLYEVHDFWFDKRITNITTIHKIQYDALKKEYSTIRTWEKASPLVVLNFEKARQLITEIKSLEVIQLKSLKKGKHYQLRVKSELNDRKYFFSKFPWEFETDWYTINFIY